MNGIVELPGSLEELILERVYTPVMKYYSKSELVGIVASSQPYDLQGINKEETATIFIQLGIKDQVVPVDMAGARVGDWLFGFSYVPGKFDNPLADDGEYVF